MPGRGFAAMTPERRAEVQAKALARSRGLQHLATKRWTTRMEARLAAIEATLDRIEQVLLRRRV